MSRTHRWGAVAAVVLSGWAGSSCAAPLQEADLVLHGGRVVTVDADRPEGSWVAVRGDRIAAVGDGDGYRDWVGSQTRVIDTSGQLVIPGLIESHGHFLGFGQAQMMLDLSRARSWNEIVGLVAEAVAKAEPGEWIIGRGWHQEKWDEKPEPNLDGYPTHESLSGVSPNNPVLLTHASGHMSFANAYAMQLANITSGTKDPAGGEVLRTADGMPSGVFRETAQGLLARARARGPQSAEGDDDEGGGSARKAIELATEQCWRHGITTFHDAGADFGTIALFRELAESGQLGVRLYVMIRASNAALARQLDAARLIGGGNHMLTVRAIKVSIDGALGPHGAWLLAPYEDLPTSVGLNTVPVESLEETARLALEHDYQLCVHAIGDKANQAVLDVYDRAFQASPAQVSRRWRIEHAQHLDPADIPRFGQLGVIASMQGIHCTSDAVYVMQRLGSRRAAQGAYVWKSLLDQGAVICNGTDVPVEAIDPIASFAASVTRKLDSGVTFFPEQCMTREQALRSYTLDAAYAAFEEELKGSLTPGKLADLVVLSKDILTCPDDEIRAAHVTCTVIGGQVRYEQAR